MPCGAKVLQLARATLLEMVPRSLDSSSEVLPLRRAKDNRPERALLGWNAVLAAAVDAPGSARLAGPLNSSTLLTLS